VTVLGFLHLHLPDFAHPAMFAALIVPVVLFAGYLLAQRRRRERLRRFAGSMAATSTASGPARLLGVLPLILSMIAVVLLIVFVAGPIHDVEIPRNRAAIVLAIDVSESMAAADVTPTRLGAAQHAATAFAQGLTPGINLGLVAFAGNAYLLVSPTIDHQATVNALSKLSPDTGTATGEALFTALQAVATLNDELAGSDTGVAPASIVLLSDGEENRPANPSDPHGDYTAARLARQRGIPISTIAIGTRAGFVTLDDQTVPVPVDDEQMRHVADLSGGRTYHATDVEELSTSYAATQQHIGYQTVPAPTATVWLRSAVLVLTAAALAALAIHRRLPA
jgi:Ca-activated chloride channel family protein